jgi:hypothetical protein
MLAACSPYVSAVLIQELCPHGARLIRLLRQRAVLLECDGYDEGPLSPRFLIPPCPAVFNSLRVVRGHARNNRASAAMSN